MKKDLLLNTRTDLLVKHLEQYIRRNYAPDGIAKEKIKGKEFILFYWNSGKERCFGYTPERFGEVFNRYLRYKKDK